MAEASRIEANIKRLCCSGLGGEALMPVVLREIAKLVPNYSSTFFWCGRDLQIANMYDDNPAALEIAPVYFGEFYNRRECEVHRGFSDAMRNDRGVGALDDMITVDRATWERSDYFNVVMRHLGYHDGRRLTVRDAGRPLGSLNIWRGAGDPPFTLEEDRILGRLETFIAHALGEPRELDVELVADGRCAMIVANGEGRLIHLSPQARQLLTLASNPRIAPGRLGSEPAALPSALVRICRNLLALTEGCNAVTPPVHRHRNAWGGFVFRAYRLEPVDGSACLVGVTIEHQEPLPVRLARGLRGLPLAPRQAEVCVLMARGLTYAEIARRLDMSRHTAVATGRRIYDKLGVASRAELFDTLLARGEEPALRS